MQPEDVRSGVVPGDVEVVLRAGEVGYVEIGDEQRLVVVHRTG